MGLRRGKPGGLAVFREEALRFSQAKGNQGESHLSRARWEGLVWSNDEDRIRHDIDLLITADPETPAPDDEALQRFRKTLQRFEEAQADNPRLIGGTVSLRGVKSQTAVLTLFTKKPDAALNIEAADKVDSLHSWDELSAALGAAGLAACQIQLAVKNGAAVSQSGQSHPYDQLAQLFEAS